MNSFYHCLIAINCLMDKSKGLPESSPLDLFVAYNSTYVHQFIISSFTQFLLCQTYLFSEWIR